MLEYKNNNEVIEALKKAHLKEIAAHVQEHNRKFNDLLQAKMDSEDQLKEEAEQEKQRLAQEWQQKLQRAVEETKRLKDTDWAKKMQDMKD